MREMASKHTNVKQLLLFGRGNDLSLIQEFAREGDLLGHIVIGIIEAPDGSEGRYYDLFDLSVDPRLVILKDNRVQFIETIDSQGQIGPGLLADTLND